MSLFVRTWPVPQPTATVCICHGLGEHSGRYDQVARRLNLEGWSVVAPDHRGHGMSDGRRGHIDRWAEYVEQFHEALDANADASLPRALMGQSMGGLIVAGYARTYGDELTGLVLLSPMFGIGVPVSPALGLAARVLSRVLPTFSVVNRIEPDALSRDLAVAATYRSDPLVHERVTARWLTEAKRAMADAYRGAGEIRTPLLLCLGASDRVADVARARAVFERFTMADRQLRTYPGRHELLHEIDRGEILEGIITWLKERLGSRGPTEPSVEGRSVT